jgi:phosphoribosylaminoimidazolecarboxamide formyltransferase/IMP cyclohydrolase
MDVRIRRALLSVTDKSGLVEFARGLAAHGVDLVSTGGTARVLREAGLTVLDVSAMTGAPEMMDGRVKTLHPGVHGGILAVRDNPEHLAAMQANGIQPIDMVVVNLYPFERATSDANVALEAAVENIDIGGPSMIRSAAKNHEWVAVVTDPADYPALGEELARSGGALSLDTRRRLMAKAFQRTAAYDRAIAEFFGQRFAGEQGLPAALTLGYERDRGMRYGENPHQSAALYRRVGAAPRGLFAATVHQGKEISYNNLVDLEAAVDLAAELPDKACVIVKHTNPCGAAVSRQSLEAAWVRALETDPVSAFGGIVAFNDVVDDALAARLSEIFLEIVVARGFTPGALEALTRKKNLRVVTWPDWEAPAGPALHEVRGGLLVQSRDLSREDVRAAKVVTRRAPTPEEWDGLAFGWTVCKFVKSNAIVISARDGLIGVGAGQMSRVDSTDLAIRKARLPVKGAVLASDAFFPFRDGVDLAAKAGVTAIVQPGGSMRDAEAIEAADEQGLAMVFTGVRHFRHS